MMELLRQVYPLRLAPVSGDTDRAVAMLLEELPFKVHEYPTGSEYNGWVVPQKWEVTKAEIRKDGKLLYDGMHHPLGVIGYSRSFQGRVTAAELKDHLYYHPELPEALVYHYRGFYRSWEENWGFSVPRTLYESLDDGDYQVDLQTSFETGTMKVCDYFLPGASSETIVLAAHTCHAAQANDDISGVVVGIEIMKRLARRDRRYSYRLLIGPEQFSAVFYLANLAKSDREELKYCVFLEALGNDNRLALQRSFTGETELDRAAYSALRHRDLDLYDGAFRTVLGNDETVWEAPGYEVPTVSISRVEPLGESLPYPEYHSSLDTEEIIQEDRLEDSVDAILDIVHVLETNACAVRRFEGHIALSNPRYDLFLDPRDPAMWEEAPARQQDWFYLMTCLPRYMDGKQSILEIALKHNMPYAPLYQYLKRFEEKGLLRWVACTK